MNIFALSRRWWDWTFKNPDLIKPNHSALYFFAIEHCNRMGWKRKFGLPTAMAKEAIGIKSYRTFKETLDDLIEWGFIEMVESSRNQWSSNIIALVFFDEAYVKAHDEPLDKAMLKHVSKQGQSTGESKYTIDIHNNQETKRPIDQETNDAYPSDFEDAWNMYERKGSKKKAFAVWKRMDLKERDKAINAIESYFSERQDRKYRKDFERYLNDGVYEADHLPSKPKQVNVRASSNFWKPNLDADGRRIYD